MDGAIQKIAIVRYHDESTRVVPQEIFEPTDCVNIEMIGRLIQEKEIGFCEEELCQVEPVPFSAAQQMSFLS